MSSLTVRWVLGVCCALGVAASCSGAEEKKAVADNGSGAGGEQEAGGARAGSNASGKSQGGGAGSASGGAPTAGSTNGGAGGEGNAAAPGGAAGEGASAPGAGGAGGAMGQEGGAGGALSSCCDPQVSYLASSGLLPSEEACAPWTLSDSAEPEVPTFNGGGVRVSTSADAENMYFIQGGENLSFPKTFVFEARMKLVSGAGSTTSRAPASMGFVYGTQHMKNMLQMSATQVFILESENVKGDTMTFDTTSDFHTYKLVVDTEANTLQVFIDDQLELTGNTYADPSSNPFVLFGESSIYANGVSEWQFAKHNAYRCTPD